jgi:secondary thiamine-phosphate synthase enzyme
MKHSKVRVSTKGKTQLQDITGKVQDALKSSGAAEGMCTVYVPHTTCGVTINENADPSVKEDILMELDKTIPMRDGYSHMEGNSAAHIKATLTGISVSIPVAGGSLMLGTWQGIFLCEYDGPRTRSVIVSVTE